MSEFLFYYHGVSLTTWVYLSSLLMIGLYFKFARFWSVRNLDLILLILLSPGLVLIHFGWQFQLLEETLASAATNEAGSRADPTATESDAELAREDVPGAPPLSREESADVAAHVRRDLREPSAGLTPGNAAADEAMRRKIRRAREVKRLGYVWLFCAGGLLLARLLVDSMMVRRPLLVPNLSVGGLTFIGCSLFVFLMANVIAGPTLSREPARMSDGVEMDLASRLFISIGDTSDQGPGYALLRKLPLNACKVVAIAAHFALVLGVVLVGYWHFDNITMGIGAATLYLMLPYTAQMTGRVDHVLPAAFLVWAVLCYPRPFAAGCCLGLAAGIIYYPLFLLPLWISFYWQRGLLRFGIGVIAMLAVLATVLAFQAGDTGYVADLQRMFGLLRPRTEGLEGVWNTDINGWDPTFRLPVLALFVALCAGMALWPAQKNFGTLLSCSAAVMLAAQFWHGFGGGTYMAWYLPLTLLTIFRPNLEDRVALTVLEEGWFPRRRAHLSSVGKAA